VGELYHLGHAVCEGELDQGALQHTFIHELTIDYGHELGAQKK
jgi:hypothetical protein